MKTIAESLQWAARELEVCGIESPHLDASVLLSFALNKDRLYLATRSKEPVSSKKYVVFASIIERRKNGEPVAYLVGRKEFFGYDFIVTPDVLIPRPDTEVLVEKALAFLPNKKNAKVIDACAGTGCVGLSIGLKRANSRIWATDISGAAIEVAKQNARLHKIEDRVSFFNGNLVEPIAGLKIQFDILVSNPPYIKQEDYLELDVQVKDYEPRLALVGADPDGLAFHKKLIESGLPLLRVGGHILLEIGFDQGEALGEWAVDRGLPVQIFKDYGKNNRVICIEKLKVG